MKFYRRLKQLCIIGFFIGLVLRLHADSVEGLIDQTKKENDRWTTEGEELPPVLMLGDESAVRIYHQRMDDMEVPALCTHLSVDELVESASSEGSLSDIPVNTRLSRIQERLADACLIRPQDELMAVGPGIQKKVSLKEVFLRQEKGGCQGLSNRGLWMSFDELLPFAPFFFSSDASLKEGPNQFVSGDDKLASTLPDEWREKIKKEVPFLEDFRYVVQLASAPNCLGLVRLIREKVEKDDEGLANEMVVSVQKDDVSILAEEKVTLGAPSGHLKVVGTLDWNMDGFIDVLIEGDRGGCFYRSLFSGTEDGFDAVDFPKEPCGC